MIVIMVKLLIYHYDQYYDYKLITSFNYYYCEISNSLLWSLLWLLVNYILKLLWYSIINLLQLLRWLLVNYIIKILLSGLLINYFVKLLLL